MSETNQGGTGSGTSAAILYLHAQTAMHPGSGTALGTVDLPVQRERHTQWPVVPGSALKGILRDRCRRRNGNNGALFAAFGPETSEADKHAGALSVTDARILAFPVRSLRGVFAWVTCRAVLTRFERDLVLAGRAGGLGTLPDLAPGEAAVATGSPLLVDEDKLVFEEFEFIRRHDSGPWGGFVAAEAVGDPATQARLEKHLVVLHDDDFTHFVRHATEVVARVALEYETKTVRPGALFYQEFLPAETLFYALVLAGASRREGDSRQSAEMLAYLSDTLGETPVLQVGGDETTGKGLCAARLVPAR